MSVYDQVRSAFMRNYGSYPDEVLEESTYRGFCHLRHTHRKTGEAEILTDLHVFIGYARGFSERLPTAVRGVFVSELSMPQEYSYWQYVPSPLVIERQDIDIERQYVSANHIRKHLTGITNGPVITANQFFSAVASVIQKHEAVFEDHIDRYVQLHFNLLPKYFTIAQATALLCSLQ